MKHKKIQNFIEWNRDILVNSFKKINLNILLIAILDALFYFLSGYLVIFWLQRIKAKIAAFNLPPDIISLGPERARQLVSGIREFYFLIILSFMLLLIAIIFLASILKGIIWAKTANAKINFRLISKFLALNLIWMGFWFVLVILISYLVEPAFAPSFMIAAIVLGFYFTNTLYTLFMKKHELKSIIKAVRLNIMKIHLFLLPYLLIAVLFYFIVKLGFLNFRYSQILLGFILLIYSAIVRYYASALVLAVEETK